MDRQDGGLLMRDKQVTKLTQTAILLTKRKFCSHCQSFKLLDGGANKRVANGSRWICAGCIERKRKP
jgi:RNase P subunit RPR2